MRLICLHLAELTRLCSRASAGPCGRALRKSVDRLGNHQFACVELSRSTEWVPIPLVDLHRSVSALLPADDCSCSDGCSECHGLGYAPQRPTDLRTAQRPLLDTPHDIADHYEAMLRDTLVHTPMVVGDDEPDDDEPEQLNLLDLLEE